MTPDNLEQRDLATIELYAKEGCAKHMFELAQRYRKGCGVETNHAAAFEWYLKSAELGNKRGTFMVGVCYRDGAGVVRNDTEAANWFLDAACRRHPVAMYNSYMYSVSDRAGNKNPLGAVTWLYKAADLGHGASLLRLSLLLRNGSARFKLAVDIEQALAFDRKRCALGTPQERHRLAHNLKVNGDIDDAYIWYQLSQFEDWAEQSDAIRKQLAEEIPTIELRLEETRNWVEKEIREHARYCWWRDDDEFTHHISMRTPRE